MGHVGSSAREFSARQSFAMTALIGALKRGKFLRRARATVALSVRVRRQTRSPRRSVHRVRGGDQVDRVQIDRRGVDAYRCAVDIGLQNAVLLFLALRGGAAIENVARLPTRLSNAFVGQQPVIEAGDKRVHARRGSGEKRRKRRDIVNVRHAEA